MSERRHRIPAKHPDRPVLRGIRPGFGPAIALILLVSANGCHNPGPVGPPSAADTESQVRPESAVEKPAAEFEPEVSLRSAAENLPAALLNGPDYKVRDEVVARGYIHYYVIESRFGEFLAAGDDEVGERIREINAIAELRRLSKSEIITDSATDAAKRGYVAAKQVIDKPMETARGIPLGLARLFKRSKRQAEDAYDKVSEWYQSDDGDDASAQTGDGRAQEKGITQEKIRKVADLGIDESQDYLKGSLGFNRERRRLARRLGVDPYTRNAVLREELASMAWVATAGSFAANLILPDVPAPVGLLKDTQELVWNTKAIDLRLRNEAAVRRMGTNDDTLEAFFGNQRYTLSDQTRVVQAAERLHDVINRAELLHSAAQAQSREEARFYVRSAELLALYHEQRAPLEQLFEEEHGPIAARDEDGRLIVALPLDYLNWSRSTHDIASLMQGSLKRHALSTVPEVWIRGTVTERARQEIFRLGWTTHERAFEHLAPGGPNAG